MRTKVSDDQIMAANAAGMSAAEDGKHYGDNPHLDGNADLRRAWDEGWAHVHDHGLTVARPVVGKPCSICHQPIPAVGTWTGGCNAQPINDGRCCDDCNRRVVIPARIALLNAARGGAK